MSQPILVIGNRNYSSWSLRAWLLLSHFGLSFTVVPVHIDQPDTRARLQPSSADRPVTENRLLIETVMVSP